MRIYNYKQSHYNKRHYFANKGPSSQTYGFPSSHVWMWELDYKENWAPKNWCFWTIMLEKTLESPLDSKEIQPVHPRGKHRQNTQWHKSKQDPLWPTFSVQVSSVAQACSTVCNPMDCSMPGFLVHHQLRELAQMHVHRVSDAIHLLLCNPLLLLPSIFPNIRVFSNESVLHISWPKYWSFSISPSNEYSELISFRIDWFDLAVQGILKSLL